MDKARKRDFSAVLLPPVVIQTDVPRSLDQTTLQSDTRTDSLMIDVCTYIHDHGLVSTHLVMQQFTLHAEIFALALCSFLPEHQL